jgi:acyl-CoA thioesterase
MAAEGGMNQKEKFKQIVERKKPLYYDFLGIDILNVEFGYSKLKMDYNANLTNPYGLVNGGFFSVLADAAVACALLSMTEETPSRKLVTVEYKMNIIRPVKEGSITAEAKIMHLGREIAVGETTITNSNDVVVALGLMTYSVRY